MFKNLAYKFANILINNEVIENKDFEIYRYGFETLIYFVVNILVALFIGIIFDRFIQTIVFLSCYCTLRQFTGGYHARNYTECTLTFVFIYLITIFVDNSIDIDKYKYILIVVFIMSILIIHKLAPLEHRNKPFSIEERKAYKKIANNIILGISIIFILFMSLNIFKEYIIYSLFAVVWISVLLIIGYNINLH